MDELDRPWILHTSLGVKQARDAYLAQNGFSVEAYDEISSEINYAGIRFRVPNPPQRRWAIRLHDLHHVASGFGTDPVGEAEISAWEVGHGLGNLGLYVSSLVLSGVVAGLFLAPRRAWRAFRAARSGRSLFNLSHLNYEQLLAMNVGELRDLLGIPAHGLATHTPHLHASAPAPSV